MRRQRVLATSNQSASGAVDRVDEIRHFVDRHSQRVVGALTLMCGDRAAAEDAVQEALAKAWVHVGEPIDRLEAWVTVVATNHVRSTYRRRAAEGRALTKVGVRALPAAPDSQPPDDALLAALGSLSERERQVAVLHYALDESVASIASALGVADGTVKTLLSRARQHLAGQLNLDERGDR